MSLFKGGRNAGNTSRFNRGAGRLDRPHPADEEEHPPALYVIRRLSTYALPHWKPIAITFVFVIFQAGLALQFRRERDDVRNDAVDSLRDVDAALEVGAFLGLTIGRWHTRLLAVPDVADAHDGRVFTLTTEYTLPPIEVFTLTLGISGTYADDDYMETYFSIDTNNAVRSGLPRFEAEAGLKDVGAHLTLRYQESRHWSALAIFKYARLLGDAADSPIVDDVGSENQFFAGLIAIYTF